jgi:(S)-2-hydroxy-acid oxidase
MAHFTGEIGMAKGASMAHTLMIVSNFCTSNIEDIARQNPNAFLMLHIYLQDIDIIKNMIRTAEKCNFKGIVLTMNSADDGKYNSDGENNYQLLKSFKKRNVREVEEDDDNNKNHNNNDDDARSIITNISSATIHAIPLSESINENLNQDIELDSHITWNTIKELKSLTRLPIIIKDILTEEDAKLAVENGADGIIVSNDDSRQSVCTTLEALPVVAKAVNKRIPVFLDGGIRRGSDIFKAIALGADAVFVGRPAIWALNAMGADGVKKMMDILTDEFRLTMAIAGCTRVDQISPKHIQHKMTYKSKL